MSGIEEGLGSRRFGRRAVLRTMAGGTAALAGAGWLGRGARPARAAKRAAPDNGDLNLPAGMLPPPMGQSTLQVYVPATGHTVSGMMLDYWRATGAASGFGNPVSEPFASADVRLSQAFENGVFQFWPEYLWSDFTYIQLMPIGRLLARQSLDAARTDGRRPGGGGNKLLDNWTYLDPSGPTVAKAISQGATYFKETGHTLGGDFQTWYQAHEGFSYLGYPISEPIEEKGRLVQYFEGGALAVDSNGTSLLPLGVEAAKVLRLDTSPVDQGDLPVFDELMFWIADNPSPQGDPRAPGPKWIEVSIAQQTLWAYQGETLISTTLVSTGIPPNNTKQGHFHVRNKREKETMSGFTNSTGEVVSLGTQQTVPGSIPYVVKDIPHVMYFNSDADALHGAYWHNNFGHPMSHGCVNLPLPFAAWLFGWSPVGTAVWVHA